MRVSPCSCPKLLPAGQILDLALQCNINLHTFPCPHVAFGSQMPQSAGGLTDFLFSLGFVYFLLVGRKMQAVHNMKSLDTCSFKHIELQVSVKL